MMGEKKGANMSKRIDILKSINENNYLSQRNLAKNLHISLGKVNSILKELIEEGILVYEKNNNKFRYKFTEKGIEYFESVIRDSRDIKIKFSNTSEYREVTQAVILGAGVCKDFDKPVGLLNLEEDITLIDRNIEILKENGIQDILVVVGYKKEYYEQIKNKHNITLINSDKYKWTGTMASLELAKDFIKGDFLLLENDVIFEERAVSTILKNENSSCLLITTESGSYDEAFVEIRNGFLYKISKDMHALNQIHGEMVGISKISYEVFQKMLEEFSYNKNPYINYEYILLDVSRYYKIGYEKVDDLIWFEIDNISHYKNVINYIYPTLKRRELEMKINLLRQYIIDALNINESSITEIVPCGGMTNKNYKVTIDGKLYILRVPGAGTEEMIDRNIEKENAELGYKIGVDAKIIYFDAETGIKISEYIKGAETLTPMAAKKENNMKAVTDILRTLHNSNIKFNNRFDILGKIQSYERLIEKYGGENFADYETVREKVMKIYKALEDMKLEDRPCHNDTVPENFVKSSEDKLYLIDWEYSGMNDPMWDLAAHSIECKFSEDDEELLLKLYLGKNPDEDIKKRILIHKIMQDFLWAIWTVLKEAKGDDFGTYGLDRYNRAKENIEKFEELYA